MAEGARSEEAGVVWHAGATSRGAGPDLFPAAVRDTSLEDAGPAISSAGSACCHVPISAAHVVAGVSVREGRADAGGAGDAGDGEPKAGSASSGSTAAPAAGEDSGHEQAGEAKQLSSKMAMEAARLQRIHMVVGRRRWPRGGLWRTGGRAEATPSSWAAMAATKKRFPHSFSL